MNLENEHKSMTGVGYNNLTLVIRTDLTKKNNVVLMP